MYNTLLSHNITMDLSLLIRSNSVTSYEKLLNEGAVNFQDESGSSALHYSAANNNHRLVELLIEQGSDINQANYCGWTPLMTATSHGNYEIVQLLLKHGANPSVRNKLGMTALTIAACQGFADSVLVLLKQTKIKHELKPTTPVDVTPFIGAALFGRHEILSILFENGAAINQTTATAKLTALMMAACMNKVLSIRKLLEFGANANIVNICHRSALEMAYASNQFEAQVCLKEITTAPTSCCNLAENDEMKLLEATSKGDVDAMLRILKSSNNEKSIVSSSQNKLRVTPLMQASILGSKEAVALLIKQCGNLDTQEPVKGFTALMFAVYYNKAEIVSLLLNAGASFDTQANGGITAIDLAWVYADKPVTQMLLSKRKKKHKVDTEETITPQLRRNTKVGLLRKDSFKSLVDNLASRFQSLRKRSSATSSSYSPGQNSLVDYVDSDEGTVFADSQDSGNSRCSGKSGSSNDNQILKFPTPQFHKNAKSIQNLSSPPSFTALESTMYISPIDQRRLASTTYSNKPSHPVAFISSLLIKKLREKADMSSTQSDLKCKPRKIPQQKTLKLVVKPTPKVAQLSVPVMPSQLTFNCMTNPASTVKNILDSLSLEAYVDVFIENEVDFETFKAITEDDLHEMNVLHPEHCQKILGFISKL